jgi:hypothetical protein
VRAYLTTIALQTGFSWKTESTNTKFPSTAEFTILICRPFMREIIETDELLTGETPRSEKIEGNMLLTEAKATLVGKKCCLDKSGANMLPIL